MGIAEVNGPSVLVLHTKFQRRKPSNESRQLSQSTILISQSLPKLETTENPAAGSATTTFKTVKLEETLFRRPTSVMEGFGARQAGIDYHLEMARRCLALPASQCSQLSNDLDPLQSREDVIKQPRLGSRIAAKIVHLQNLIATLAPVPATTEAEQSSMFNRFRASVVETLWSDRREHSARDRMDTQPRLVQQVHLLDPPTSRRSLDFSISSLQHRRAGSSRI